MILDRRNCCVCAGKGIQRRALILTPEKRLPLCAEDAHKFWQHMNEDTTLRVSGAKAQKAQRRRVIRSSKAGAVVRQWAMERVQGVRQRKVYDAITRHVAENGTFPSMNDIVPRIGIGRANIHTYVNRLQDHGFILRVGDEIRPVNRSQQV
jgi:SOS-response transcriptional repressor LexA